jgi:hypothetical protein
MEVDYTAYLSKLNDVDLGLFWIIASPRAREWIKEELTRRAAARSQDTRAEAAPVPAVA